MWKWNLSIGCWAVCVIAVGFVGPAMAQPSIQDYAQTRTITLPPSFNGVGDFDDNVLFDDLPDGRLMVLNGNEVSFETGVQSGLFGPAVTLPNPAPLFGSPFLKVSPDGSRAAIGSNFGGTVTVFETSDPVGTATDFAAFDTDAAWLDNNRLAITNSNGVDVLDVTSGVVTNVVTNVGGASAGIAFDTAGNLYTGNGFDFAPGGSNTGSIKVFDAAAVQAVLGGETAIDFEASGIEVADLLSAASLGFDAGGNLFVGGGDVFGDSGDFGYAALVDADALAARLADPLGTSVIDASSPGSVLRQFVSPADTVQNQQPPFWGYNDATGELYLRYFEGDTVLVLAVPEPGTAVLLAGLGLLGLGRRSRRRGRLLAGGQAGRVAGLAAVVGVCSVGVVSVAMADPYADTVVDYTPGLNPVSGFTDAAASLGEPTRVTNPASPFGGATTPFQAAFGTDEIVSIGEGGSLTVAFDTPVTDDPLNPFGIDLLVFGNAFYTDTAFPNGVAGGIFSEGGVIEVSADGVNFVAVPGLDADGAFPTLGFLDPSGAVTFGGNPVTGTVESDFTKPVDPTFDPTGLGLSAILAGYDGSGGGVGIDLAPLGLSEVSFVRISNPLGSGVTPEIDGFADVAPVPEPTGLAVLGGLAGLAMVRRGRLRRG